jgi:hypothetical protein
MVSVLFGAGGCAHAEGMLPVWLAFVASFWDFAWVWQLGWAV